MFGAAVAGLTGCIAVRPGCTRAFFPFPVRPSDPGRRLRDGDPRWRRATSSASTTGTIIDQRRARGADGTAERARWLFYGTSLLLAQCLKLWCRHGSVGVQLSSDRVLFGVVLCRLTRWPSVDLDAHGPRANA